MHVYKVSPLKNDNAEIDIQSTAGAGEHWEIYHDKATDDLRFWKDGDDRVVFTDGSRVGIGAKSPGYDLDVNGDINFTGTLYQNGAIFSGGGESLWTQGDVNDIYRVDGYVGIGTDDPQVRLDVHGDTHVTDNLLIGGFIGITECNDADTYPPTRGIRIGDDSLKIIVLNIGNTTIRNTMKHLPINTKEL